MRTLITGATGLLGTRLVPELLVRNHDLVLLARNPEKAKSKFDIPCEILRWDPLEGPPPLNAFNGVENVIHLAGENVAQRRWNEKLKTKIRDSRVLSTRHLIDALHRRKGKPVTLISASATGFYGDRGEELLNELSSPGQGFLADVAKAREAEANALGYGFGRVVTLRIGSVLDRQGGLLKRTLPIFRKGFGGVLGTGRQWIPWIHSDDVVQLVLFALENHALEGALNAVAPNPVTNLEFSETLGKLLGKKAALKKPEFAIRTLMGEMSDLFLNSQRVVPAKPISAGFRFRYEHLEEALRSLLTQPIDAEDWQSQTWVEQPIEKVVPLFSSADHLKKMCPPWVEIEQMDNRANNLTSTEINAQCKVKGLAVNWHSEVRFKKIKGGTLVLDRTRIGLKTPGFMAGLARKSLRNHIVDMERFRHEQFPKILAGMIH